MGPVWAPVLLVHGPCVGPNTTCTWALCGPQYYLYMCPVWAAILLVYGLRVDPNSARIWAVWAPILLLYGLCVGPNTSRILADFPYLWYMGGGCVWVHRSLLTGTPSVALLQKTRLFCTPPPQVTGVTEVGPTEETHGPHEEGTHSNLTERLS